MSNKKMYKKNQYRRTVREYVDNLDVIDGVKCPITGEQGVIRPYTNEEKAWLNQFNQEYYHNNKQYENPIHNTAYKKELNNTDNARRRDLLNAQSQFVDRSDNLVDRLADIEEDELNHLVKTIGYEDTVKTLISNLVDLLTSVELKKEEIKDELALLICKTTKVLKIQKKITQKEKAK